MIYPLLDGPPSVSECCETPQFGYSQNVAKHVDEGLWLILKFAVKRIEEA
jgi:hypothetical protein